MLAQRQRIDDSGTNRPDEPDVTLLVRRAQSGDRRAFEEIHRLHVNRIYALCLRMTADRDQALARTQDSFVKAWTSLGSFRGDSRLITWLHRLAVNVMLDHKRAEARDIIDSNVSVSEDDQGSVPQSNGSAGLRLDLETAISVLPERARMVFVLHDVEGYRLRDIAEMMGTAVGTAKAQLHRARRLMREVLKS